MPEPFPKRLAIVNRQMDQLTALLRTVIPANPFYSLKFDTADAPRKIGHLGQFAERIPFTTKQELVADQLATPPYGTNLSCPLDRFVRCHQTSGTAGVPLRWLDTAESWEWMLNNWVEILQSAGVSGADRVFCAFSFGPFIGFWLAFEAAQRMGCLVLPGGGLSSAARLQSILDQGATVLCCTPTYALRLAEVAAQERLDLNTGAVRLIIVAGEPGGSIPATRQQIEQAWPGARVYDHHGMTEVGPVSFECPAHPGRLHILESSYIAEIVHPETGRALEPGQVGELILTPLGRTGMPLLRYRTGDLVKSALDSFCQCGRSDLALEQGIIGRTDDMVVVRGVNVYPSAVEEIVRSSGEVAEYRVHVSSAQGLVEMSLEIEPKPECEDVSGLVRNLERGFDHALALRVPVRVVASDSLPRFELKSKRWHRS